MPEPPAPIDPAIVAAAQTVARSLAANARVELELPARGRVHLDRQLPFCCATVGGIDDIRDAHDPRLVSELARGPYQLHRRIPRILLSGFIDDETYPHPAHPPDVSALSGSQLPQP